MQQNAATYQQQPIPVAAAVPYQAAAPAAPMDPMQQMMMMQMISNQQAQNAAMMAAASVLQNLHSRLLCLFKFAPVLIAAHVTCRKVLVRS